MLRIRLVRQGKKDRPTWRILVMEKSKTGKGKFTDSVGHYNPFGKEKAFVFDIGKYNKWVEKGAQPTDSVLRLKGRFVDKNKDYQKLVTPKNYKKKKPEAVEEPKAQKVEEPATNEAVADAKEDVVEEKVAEAPAEETSNEAEEVAEEKAEETASEVKEEEKSEPENEVVAEVAPESEEGKE